MKLLHCCISNTISFCLDEKKLVERLPLKLQTDLALSVHYNTLSKVQLFQDADRALLRDLVLKLRPVIFLPGDMICRKVGVGQGRKLIFVIFFCQFLVFDFCKQKKFWKFLGKIFQFKKKLSKKQRKILFFAFDFCIFGDFYRFTFLEFLIFFDFRQNKFIFVTPLVCRLEVSNNLIT